MKKEKIGCTALYPNNSIFMCFLWKGHKGRHQAEVEWER